MGWRNKYKVHPAADVFPMMEGEEFDQLIENIRANGLTSPISFFVSEEVLCQPSVDWIKANGILADGRNRMEALERLGIELTPCAIETINTTEIDPASFIIGRNLTRRHLTKRQKGELIAAVHLAAAKA